jgi:transaldolase
MGICWRRLINRGGRNVITPLQSLIALGTKVWLDSIAPDEVDRNRSWGVTGATSNPVIIAELIKTCHCDEQIVRLLGEGFDAEEIAWRLTDWLVRQTQDVFLPVWRATRGDDGYVSFELDPLLEDPDLNLPQEDRTRRYIELGKRWGAGHPNRMIKVPATPAGFAALEELAAAGLKLNVTLMFTPRQYVQARDAIWRGAQRLRSLEEFKSVYSIFVSHVDVYAQKHVPQLSARARGQIGTLNAKQVWRMNQEFWADKRLPLKQEIIFASTGVKTVGDPPWKYVEAFAGSDIETNPPATNAAVQASGQTFTRQVDRPLPEEIVGEIHAQVDMQALEATLMAEGSKKFADPQKAVLALLNQKCQQLVSR